MVSETIKAWDKYQAKVLNYRGRLATTGFEEWNEERILQYLKDRAKEKRIRAGIFDNF